MRPLAQRRTTFRIATAATRRRGRMPAGARIGGPRGIPASPGRADHGRRRRAQREYVRGPDRAQRPPGQDRHAAVGLVHEHPRWRAVRLVRDRDGQGERPGFDRPPARHRPGGPRVRVLEGRQRQDHRRGPGTDPLAGPGVGPAGDRLSGRDRRDREGADGRDDRWARSRRTPRRRPCRRTTAA